MRTFDCSRFVGSGAPDYRLGALFDSSPRGELPVQATDRFEPVCCMHELAYGTSAAFGAKRTLTRLRKAIYG